MVICELREENEEIMRGRTGGGEGGEGQEEEEGEHGAQGEDGLGHGSIGRRKG